MLIHAPEGKKESINHLHASTCFLFGKSFSVDYLCRLLLTSWIIAKEQEYTLTDLHFCDFKERPDDTGNKES